MRLTPSGFLFINNILDRSFEKGARDAPGHLIKIIYENTDQESFVPFDVLPGTSITSVAQ